VKLTEAEITAEVIWGHTGHVRSQKMTRREEKKKTISDRGEYIVFVRKC
jgi:hypothetical protein